MKKGTRDRRAIGVFDSGVGGLTVAAAVEKLLPSERILYFGDLLHLPYGSKSSRAVLEFTKAAVHFLFGQDIKLLVIACNTATSIALPQIEQELDIPVIGVIAPGVNAACRISKNRNIGVIGTVGTIASGAYERALREIDPCVSVFQKATPLLVPLIEEGWMGHEVLKLVLEEYLSCFRKTSIDTMVLGCTHYPLIKREVQTLLDGVWVLDSADTTAAEVRRVLAYHDISEENRRGGISRIFLTDYTETFKIIGEKIVGRQLTNVELISLNYSKGRITYNSGDYYDNYIVRGKCE